MTLFAIVAVGVAFRLLFIEDSDLWLDEIWSVNAAAAHRSLTDVVQTALGDAHPPLYDLLLHGWLRITPDVPSAGRYLSLIFGVAGLLLTHHYVRRISGGRPAALLATALLALNHFHASHAIEARYYALVYVLALGTTSHLVLYARSGAMRDLAGFSGFALLLLYTHLYGAFLLLALGVCMVALAALRQMPATRFWRFCLAGAALGGLFAPFMLLVLRTPTHPNVAWMQQAKPAVFFEYLYNYSNKNPVEAMAICLPLVLCFRLWQRQPAAVVLLVGSVVGTAAVAYTLSVVRQPMLHERYTMVYFPSLVVLTALFWEDALRGGGRAMAFLAGAVALSSVVNLAVVNPFGERLRHEPWKRMAEALRDVPANRRAPLFAEEPHYINYYARRVGGPAARPVSERAAGELPFWYVQAEYDKERVPGSDTLAELERVRFSGKFALVRYGARQ